MKTRCLFPLLLLLPLAASCLSPAEKAASALAKRVAPEEASHITFHEVKDTVSFYSIVPVRGGVRIEGGSALDLAAGLGRYLRDGANSTVSAKALFPERFFLNYCTYGYSMPWWRWEDWEKLIDRMALNGINLPLSCTGEEAVLVELWEKYGLSREQIDAWFTGPAHLPWHRMCNIDGVDGPLPKGWIEEQSKLQKKILARERELGMTPVLPAFAGHVPKEIKELYQDACITQVSHWGGFGEENLPYFLSPEDTLFAALQRDYLRIQERMYGTDHLYAFDLFNEVDSPSWDPKTLAAIAGKAYGSVAAVDPQARWIQMGWMFHYDRKHWSQENIKAYLTAIPKGRTTILDYYTEHTPVWTMTESFYGQPFIFCYLGNFGGNTRLSGPFHKESARIGEALPHASGIGCTLEGFGLNGWMNEYVLSRAWDTGISDSTWLSLLDERRGAPHGFWQQMADSIYVRGAFSEGPLPCGRPCMKGYKSWRVIHTTPYPHETLMRLWGSLLRSPDALPEDITAIGSQVLGNLFEEYRDQFAAAFNNKDLPLAKNRAAAMQALLRDIDTLAACNPALRLDIWLESAAGWGAERNARHIITTWGDTPNLNDYASRLWGGLTGSYYARRWEIFTSAATDALERGEEFQEEAVNKEIDAFEKLWVEGLEPIDTPPAAKDVKSLAARLYSKYAPKKLHLVTYNVGSLSKHVGLGVKEVAAVIKEGDVISLNELDSCNRRHREYQIKDISEAIGAHHFHFASAFPFAGGAYGNGVISRDTILMRARVDLPQLSGIEPRSVAVTETPQCVFASAHLDVGSHDAAATQARIVNEWFKERYPCSLKPVFFAGDMNSTPDSEAIAILKEDWEVLSVTDKTYPSDSPVKCIDYIFRLKTSAPVKVEHTRVWVPSPDPSDHLPVEVSVRF